MHDNNITCDKTLLADTEDSTLILNPTTAELNMSENKRGKRRGGIGSRKNKSSGGGVRNKKNNNSTSSAQMVYRQIPVLTAFYKSKNPRFKKELLNVSPETVKAFSSLANNILSGSVPLKRGASKTLRISKVQRDLKSLADPKTSNQLKRTLLLRRKGGSDQRGGAVGLVPLIGALLPTVASLVGSIVGESVAAGRR